MKILNIIVLISSLFTNIYANKIINNNISKLNKKQIYFLTQEKLLKDEQAYNQFLLIGKVVCIETMQPEQKMYNSYKIGDMLSGLNFPIARIFKHDIIIDNFKKNIHTNIHKKRQNFSRKEDRFWGLSKRPNGSLIICESLFRDTQKNRKFYSNFMKNKSNYNDITIYRSIYDSYLKGIVIDYKYW